MNREQKAAAIAEIVAQIKESDAVFAVDFRGISVPQAADLRTRLRDADASFRVVKNTLTERAADEAGAEMLKPLLEGPTALTFVRGDAALAAKAIATFTRETQLLTFKGGMLDGDSLEAEQIIAISRLPARDVLYGQLVGMVASPITGLARGLNALLSGVAIALNEVLGKKERGELPAGEPPAAAASDEPAAEAPAAAAEAAEATADVPQAADEAPAADATEEAPAPETPDQDAEPPTEPAAPEEPAEGDPDTTTDDKQADASA
ncbi:MAG TPA: 50S ribosomal protein L10 [Beijerinckiaceae bacterium]|nr:50S ribosomal protein L10 [Beijerinckiaceae bacterium]